MTYVSHAVRSLRRDPADEPVGLVLTLADDASAERVGDEIRGLGGSVDRELEFGRLLVEVDQSDLDAVCDLDGVTSVETDAVIDSP